MKARSIEYTSLINRLVANEPRGGYQTVHQIGDLSRPELAAVLQHESALLNDAACSDLLIDSICGTLTSITRDAEAQIGAAVVGVLTAEVRQFLLTEVQEECRRDEENRRADEADHIANALLFGREPAL